MDSTALHELIAQIRGTTAALAEAEQRVASVTAELAQQAPLAQPVQPISDAYWKARHLRMGGGRLSKPSAPRIGPNPRRDSPRSRRARPFGDAGASAGGAFA